MKKEVIIPIVLLLVVGGSALFAMNKFKKDAKKVEPPVEPIPDVEAIKKAKVESYKDAKRIVTEHENAKRIITEHEKKVVASLDFKTPFRIR